MARSGLAPSRPKILSYQQPTQQQQPQQQPRQLQQQQPSKDTAVQQQQQQEAQQLQQLQQLRRVGTICNATSERMRPATLIVPFHGPMRAQRLRGGGSSNDGSDDEEITPDARRAALADPGTPVRAAKRRLDAEPEAAQEAAEKAAKRQQQEAALEARKITA